MSHSPLVRAFRPVSPESLHDLEVFKTAREIFPRHTIHGRAVLGASIVSRNESRQFDSSKYSPRPTNSLRSVFYPYPESTTRPLTLEVTDVAFLGHHLSRRSLALILDDPAGTLLAEREEYFRRMEKTIAQQMVPHVSVLNIESTHSTQEVLDWAQSVAPPSISLEPITTYPELTPPTPKKIRQPKTKSSPAVHSPQPDYSNTVVKRLDDRPPIPDGLLQAVRRHHSQTPVTDSV